MASLLKKYTHQIKVYYEDTDAGGIVYYANYLKYFERARSELIYSLGYNHKELNDKFDIKIVVHKFSIIYKKPLFFEDKITVETFIKNVSNLRIEMEQNILRDKEVLAEAIVELVTVDNLGKPKIIPNDLKGKLSSCI
ncbi:MAG: YbgC/FadM family acyl-CoA thioesterase [Candidatus Fonsibacter sp.]|nr:YbgC/FadM family acyl-CoA thioesterase [Candidatus Fonsibacter sp.]